MAAALGVDVCDIVAVLLRVARALGVAVAEGDGTCVAVSDWLCVTVLLGEDVPDGLCVALRDAS